jgi:ribosomal protein S18 acetylase RimI-like enzyme
MSEVSLRWIEDRDLEFLRAMFLETICWREDGPRRSLDDVLADPSLAKYVVGWGRPGDSGVLAVSNSDERLGAAWYRLFNEDDQGYGFVSPNIPQLGIATLAEYRGRGLGRTLMQGLIQHAMSEGRPALSLSVEEDNWRALRLYQDLGFERVGQVGNSWTMVLSLDLTGSS